MFQASVSKYFKIESFEVNQAAWSRLPNENRQCLHTVYKTYPPHAISVRLKIRDPLLNTGKIQRFIQNVTYLRGWSSIIWVQERFLLQQGPADRRKFFRSKLSPIRRISPILRSPDVWEDTL